MVVVEEEEGGESGKKNREAGERRSQIDQVDNQEMLGEGELQEA